MSRLFFSLPTYHFWYLWHRHHLESNHRTLLATHKSTLSQQVISRVTNGIQDVVKWCIKSWVHLDIRPDIKLFNGLQPLPYVRRYMIVNKTFSFLSSGAGRSSEVERSFMVQWVVGSILHGVDPLSYFSFQPELHDWCSKGRGMCYPVCGMVHIKEPLLLIDKSSLGSGFPFSLSEWPLTICLTPYNRR